MIRKTYSRYAIPASNFIHRSSVYRMARPDDALAIINEARLMSGVSKDVLTLDEESVVLPPKQPLPDVILRAGIMPKQRSRVAL